MDRDGATLPDDVEVLKALLAAARAMQAVVCVGRDAAVVEADATRAKASDDSAMIAYLKLEIAKLRHQSYC
jgi:hypothetical protein